MLSTVRLDPASVDPSIYVRAEARKDPRIGREMRGGRLFYYAIVNGVRIEDENILAVYDSLP